MKGSLESSFSMSRRVIITLIVLAIVVVVAHYSGYLGEASAEPLDVTGLCPNWITLQCTQSSAAEIIGVGEMTLQEICIQKYPGADWWEECKKECLGCP